VSAALWANEGKCESALVGELRAVTVAESLCNEHPSFLSLVNTVVSDSHINPLTSTVVIWIQQ